jgi:hypothetical protein
LFLVGWLFCCANREQSGATMCEIGRHTYRSLSLDLSTTRMHPTCIRLASGHHSQLIRRRSCAGRMPKNVLQDFAMELVTNFVRAQHTRSSDPVQEKRRALRCRRCARVLDASGCVRARRQGCVVHVSCDLQLACDFHLACVLHLGCVLHFAPIAF